MEWKKAGANVLLWFVLITIGFAIGKEVTLRSFQAAPDKRSAAPEAPPAREKTLVYYMHATVRCVTCNTIEKMAHKVVQQKFAAEIQSGRMEWQVVNFQEREDLAKRYNVASNGVVLVEQKNGKDVRSRTLEDVWTLMDDPPAFDKYVADAIRAYLAPEEKP